MAIVLAAIAGARLGELCSLRWSDIDLEGGTAKSLPMTVQRAFRDLLGDDWVVQQPSRLQPLTVTVGPGGAVPQALPPLTVQSFTVRDRMTAVALTEESITVQTTSYRHYPEFRQTLSRAVRAAAEVVGPDGVTRVGMRYIDEVRVPGIADGDPARWLEWVDPSLLAPMLGPMGQAGLPVAGWEGAAQYLTGPEQKLVLRYATRTGYAVNPEGLLKRPRLPASGPFFLLDFDSFWEPSDIPEFEPERIMGVCDDLRAPIRKLFDMLVTDKLLTEFRKEKSN